jgi:PIN domain nuclease of toxin-antitoxin system
MRKVIGAARNEILVSAASVWEITTKARLGRLPGAQSVAVDVAACIHAQGFSSLSIDIGHAQRAGDLPGPLRDPFDRMLVAQAQVEGVSLVSNETTFDDFGVRRLW